MDYVKIGGRAWDVLVTKISENFSILYSSNTGRTMSKGAKMTLDPLGTFYEHEVTVKRRQGYEQEFDELWDFVSIPRYDGVEVDIVHNQQTIAYAAYISKGSRDLKRIDKKTGKVYWDELKLNIIPLEAQVVPE